MPSGPNGRGAPRGPLGKPPMRRRSVQTAPWVERARKSLLNSFSTGGSWTYVNMLWCELEVLKVDMLNCFTIAEDSMRSVFSISTLKQTSR